MSNLKYSAAAGISVTLCWILGFLALLALILIGCAYVGSTYIIDREDDYGA